MATLWYNGSGWQSSEVNCVYQSSGSSGEGGYVRFYTKISANDSGIVNLASGVYAEKSGSRWANVGISGTRTVKSNGSNLFSLYEGAQYKNSNISATATISFTGTVKMTGYTGGTRYSTEAQITAPSQFAISSPYRTITFNANGGTGGPSSQTVLTGVYTTLTTSKPSKTGYTFLGWGTSQTATSPTYSSGGSISTTSNITLWAVWQANSYTLSITKPATALISVTKDGTAVTGTTVNYNDVLTITASAVAGYRILSLQVNGSDFVSGNTHTVTGNVSIVATTIAQSSTIATYDSTVNTLDTFNLTVNRYSESHYNIVRYYDSNDTLLYTSAVFTVGTSLVIPQSWFTNFGSVSSITITAINTTYTDPDGTPGTETGVTDSCTFTVVADPSMKPVLASGYVTLSPYNTGTGAANLSDPGYVKGYSKVRAVFDPTKITHAVGASIYRYTVTVNNSHSMSNDTTITNSVIPAQAGPLVVTLTVTDSRGRSTSATESITVNDYSAPAISSINCFRCDIDGTADENDNYLAITATCTYTSLSDNAIDIDVDVKPAGGSYTSYGTLSNAIQSIIGGAFSPDTTYIVKVTVSDTVGNSAFREINMPRRNWIFHMRQSANGPGAAFGKITEYDYALQLATGWKIMMGSTSMAEADLINILSLTPSAILNAVYPVGSIYVSTSSTSPASIFGGSWTRITGKFLLAATDGGAAGGNGNASIAPGGTGGEATHQITTNEMAQHNHGQKSLTGNLWNMAVQSASQNVSYTGIITSRGGSEGVGYATASNTRADGVTINATHTHDNVGTNTAHNNMPPYLAVYVWERTA